MDLDTIINNIKKLNNEEKKKMEKRFPKLYKKKESIKKPLKSEKISNYQITSYISKKRYFEYKNTLRGKKRKEEKTQNLKNFDILFNKKIE
jgi:hypothetical protein